MASGARMRLLAGFYRWLSGQGNALKACQEPGIAKAMEPVDCKEFMT